MFFLFHRVTDSARKKTPYARLRAGHFLAPIALINIAISAVLFAGCSKAATDKADKVAPAHVAHHVEEHELNTVTLTEKAESRLGIVLVEAKRIEVRRKRMIGGAVMLPPGKTAIVTAPMTGTLLPPENGKPPVAGARLQKGQVVFQFEPLLTAERDVLTPSERLSNANIATAKIDAERQVESAKIAVEVAQLAYDRAEKLLQNKAGSQRTVDEAKANLQLFREALQTARSRNEFLSGISIDGEQSGKIANRPIESPVDGVLQTLETATGETVSAGEVLFSVITTRDVWIQVPVYAGNWRDIDTSQPALVSEFGESSKAVPRKAIFVSAPPSANPVATTIDVFYALDNQDGSLQPGQRLSVTIPLKSRKESLVVPFKAVLYDIQGGAWVYEQQSDHVYARRRVAVEYVDGDDAILASGPEAGSKVVTDGAIELFGTEFGVGH